MKNNQVSSDERKYPRTVSLSIGVWNEIDAIAGHGSRSAFVEKAVSEYLNLIHTKQSEEKHNGG